MPNVTMDTLRFSGELSIAGQSVNVKDGVFETDDEDVLAKAQAVGYKVAGAEAPALKGDDGGAPPLVVVPSKEELTAIATELGIEVKHNWGVKKLQEAIAEAQAKAIAEAQAKAAAEGAGGTGGAE